MFESAICHQFIVIGEAIVRLRESDPGIAERLEALRIIGFRNLLVYGYDAVDFIRVRALIETDLPMLLQQLEEELG